MKRVALIVDIENWAFDLAAKIIKKELENDFIIDILYSKSDEYQDDLLKILLKVKNYDIIHFFWRKTLLQFNDTETQEKLEKNHIDIAELKQKISTGIYDHLFIGDESYFNIFNNICKKYVVSSQKLYKIYANNKNIKAPWGVLGDTIDSSLFYPKNLDRLKKDKNDPLVLGWVGNSEWNSKIKDAEGKSIDFKGFNTVFIPVVEELRNEGYNIQIYCADKNTNFITNDKMCDYYSKIDVYICVSITEGTPKPMLEAMGCGVPVITTDVGVAKEYLGEKEKEFIIGERKIGQSDDKIKEKLKNKIKRIYNNRELLLELSDENYNNSKEFNSKFYKDRYREYFLNF